MSARPFSSALAGIVFAALLGLACSSSTAISYSVIEVSPADRTKIVDVGIVDVGSSYPFRYTITNTGKKKQLCITEVKLAYTPPDGVDEAGDPNGLSFRLDGTFKPTCIAPKGEGGGKLAESVDVVVLFTRYADVEERSAALTIVNDNSADLNLRSYKIDFKTRACNPTLDVDSTLDFQSVKSGQNNTKDLALQNSSQCDLFITGFRMEGDPGFSVTVQEKSYNSETAAGMITLENPDIVKSNETLKWAVNFAPKSGDPAEANLILFTNDPSAPEGKTVKLMANSSGPRCVVEPNPVEFGGKMIGKGGEIDVRINSIGTSACTVQEIALKDPAEPHFTLKYDKLSTGKAPVKDDETTWIAIAPNQHETFTVKYLPTVKNPYDPTTKKVIPDENIAIVQNDSFTDKIEVGLSGFGVEVECPIPVIMVEEGDEVPPQTVLHLHGDQSQPAQGSIKSYSWTVTQPPENKFNLNPSNTYSNPVHQANTGGTYKYCLDVCDDGPFCSGDAQCHTTACKEIVVRPDKAIHCELTWDNPGDPDQFDEGPDAGADMDLHFTHPFATGPDIDGDGVPDGWFDIPYDCFWFNPKPDWESMNPNAHDDPSLDRDDTDGSGPENVNLDAPVDGRVFKIGVHYWDDHGYGKSYPQVKCWIWGTLAFQKNLKDMGVAMQKCDMWEVATISWETANPGKVTAITNPDGSLKITHGYMNPAFVQIGGGTCE